ncbi:MAG: hypothetical protein GY798_22165 [Hyphomicrobiales bacterium]|nr:hypothetical protein [Hyphomicrobiales bacterium]
MRFVSISMTVLTAAGIIVGAGAAASACEWHKQVNASAAPVTVEEVATVPATEIDPVHLAELSDGAIVPRKPEETTEIETE